MTGATGFIGTHVLSQLLLANATIVRVVERGRSSSRSDFDVGGIETVLFDGPEQMVDGVRRAKPDYVVHLHATVTAERSGAAIRSTLETNLLPSLDLMTACVEMQVKRLVLLGSGEEFGPNSGPFDEATAADPVSPYGASKAAITSYARMFHRTFQLPVVVLRPSVVYGPFQTPRMLIPQVMQALLEGREIAVTEGLQTRDFIHVKDVADGILCALVAESANGRSLNLASGEVVTVRECLARIERISGRTGLIRYGALPYRQGETFSYEPKVEGSFSALVWRPAISLDQGLVGTWESTESVWQKACKET